MYWYVVDFQAIRQTPGFSWFVPRYRDAYTWMFRLSMIRIPSSCSGEHSSNHSRISSAQPIARSCFWAITCYHPAMTQEHKDTASPSPNVFWIRLLCSTRLHGQRLFLFPKQIWQGFSDIHITGRFVNIQYILHMRYEQAAKNIFGNDIEWKGIAYAQKIRRKQSGKVGIRCYKTWNSDFNPAF